jgi:hypothetical protein
MAQPCNSGDRGAAVLVALNLRDEAVRHDVRLKEVHAPALTRVRPLDVQEHGDTIPSRDRLGDRAFRTFAQESVEGCDDIGAETAPARVVVVAPAGLGGEELPEQVEVFRRECRLELLGKLLHVRRRLHEESVRKRALIRKTGGTTHQRLVSDRCGIATARSESTAHLSMHLGAGVGCGRRGGRAGPHPGHLGRVADANGDRP